MTRRFPLWCLLIVFGVAGAFLVRGSPASAQRLTMRHVAVDALVFPLTPTEWALEAAVEDAGPEWERVDWMKITIDGNEDLATVNGWIGSIPWNAAGVGNPSEHVASARAQISGTIMGQPVTMQLSSLNPPGGTPPGDGEPIRFILADLRIESLKFITPISLRWDAATQVEAVQYLWDAAGHPPDIPLGSVPSTRAEPAAYVRNNPVEAKVTLFNNITGGCQIGCTLRLEGTPNTGADPLLLINYPVYPPTPKTVSGRVATFTGTTSLYNKVAHYVIDVTDLQVWVKFSTGFWGLVSLADHAWGSLFATVDTPTAPMVEPWVQVLGYSCDWARGATTQEVAATALTNGMYDDCTYEPSQAYHVDIISDTQENLYLKAFLDGHGSIPPMTGMCSTFADFLVCASNALGAAWLHSKRSADYAHLCQDDPTEWWWVFGRDWGFTTMLLTSAPVQDPALGHPHDFNFHQWTADGNFWDSSSRRSWLDFYGTWYSFFLVNKTPTDYGALVKSSGYWTEPLPAGFIPQVLNDRP